MHGTILLNRMGTNKNTYHIAWYEITRLKWDSIKLIDHIAWYEITRLEWNSNKLAYHIAWYEFMKLEWE